MEVHHHSGNSPHPGKKWVHYFWEFFMLFLAVTLGFFVENMREHAIEKKRANGLISSLLTDLQRDSASMNWLLAFRENKRRPRLEQLYRFLDAPPGSVNKKDYYECMWNVQEFYSFSPATGTLNQLKNAGYLRYFSDEELLKQISDYEFAIQDFKIDENMEYHLHSDKLIAQIKQYSDNGDMYQFFVKGSAPEGIGIKPLSPEAMQSIKAVLIEVTWYNHPQMELQCNKVKNKAIAFMDYLHKKYKE